MKNYLSTTKGSFRHTSKKPNRQRQILRYVVVAIVLIVALRLLPSVFAYVGSVVLVPVKQVDVWLTEGTGTIPTFVRDRQSLAAEITSLEAALQIASSSDATIARLENENNILRSLAGSATTTPRIIAGVIGSPGELPYDTLVIDQGSADGVKIGAVVYTGPDRVIGIVTRTLTNSAVVTLVTRSGVESTAYIIGPNIYTTAVGIGGGILEVSVPQGIPLEVGQTVILPGVSSGVFGEITIVDPRPTRPAQFAYVHTDMPILSTRLVSVSAEVPERPTFAEVQEMVETVSLEALQVAVPPGTLVDVSTSTATSTQETATSSNQETL